nr:hypothetical protein [Mycoplasmopsis bovis]
MDKKITNEYSVGNNWVAEKKELLFLLMNGLKSLDLKKHGDNDFVFINEGNNKEILSKFLDHSRTK